MAKTDWGLNDLVKPSDLNNIGNDINQLRDRLETADKANVTLQPGLQVVHAAKDARFKLGKIEGKTEINGQGRTGLIGVENPYVINTSGNLLPPFYEWGSLTETTLIEPYEAVMSPTAANRVMSFKVPIVPGEVYTLSAEHNGNVAISIFDEDSGELSSSGYQQTSSVTVKADTNAAYLRVYFSNLSSRTGTYTFKNPMLTIGTESQPFTPQRKSMLAFQTELHANPTDGSEPDVLFEQDGEYRKLAKWKKILLDGSLDWRYGGRDSEYKWVNLPLSGQLIDSGFATKYNGTLLNRVLTSTGTRGMGGDKHILRWDLLVVSISNTDSGWADDYTPTADEIKAYFNGWKMQPYSGARVDPYNGTGEKAWYPISRIQDTYDASYQVRTSPPTNIANNKDTYTPYQLLYRLAKETVEPVVTEGSLLLSEGDNMVEVGTGIVLRERAKFAVNDARTAYICNSEEVPSTRLKYKLDKVFVLYKDNKQTLNYYLQDYLRYGNLRLVINLLDYDPTAAYSVTYIKLDKSPIQSITGTLAANEKAQISDLTAGVTEALQRVSVVEQKKAEKDAPDPEWITPTLINGASQYPETTSYNAVGYTRLPDGVVRLRGLIRTTVGGIAHFVLASGYRPKRALIFPCSASGATVEVRVYASGNVIVTAVVDWLSLESISFLAEQ